MLIQSEKGENSLSTTPDLTLYWDSWDVNVPTPHSDQKYTPTHHANNETIMQSLSSMTANIANQTSSSLSSSQILPSDTHPTPPLTPSIHGIQGRGEKILSQKWNFQQNSCMFFGFVFTGDRIKFPATPPARKKNQVVGGSNTVVHTSQILEFPLTKSTSHESQLANRIDANENAR